MSLRLRRKKKRKKKRKNVGENETADEKNSFLCYLTSEMPINLKLVGWITRSRRVLGNG